MNTENLYIIKYSNWFEFAGSVLAFRKGELFDITGTPRHIPFNKYWSVNGRQLTVSVAKGLVKNEIREVDVSDLQWHHQEHLNHVFNL